MLGKDPFLFSEPERSPCCGHTGVCNFNLLSPYRRGKQHHSQNYPPAFSKHGDYPPRRQGLRKVEDSWARTSRCTLLRKHGTDPRNLFDQLDLRLKRLADVSYGPV